MTPHDKLHGRRAYDTVSAEVILAIEETVSNTRHTLRDEISALATRVETGSLLQTKEHAEVKAAINELREDLAEVKEWRKSLRTYVISLGVLIVAATGLLASLLQH